MLSSHDSVVVYNDNTISHHSLVAHELIANSVLHVLVLIFLTCWFVKHMDIKKSEYLPCNFCVCYLRMQMQTLCRAVEILITTSCSTSVKFFYRGLSEVFIASPFCDQ